ncbi:MAG: hypothetical protein ACK526_10015 [Planctomyces sp.]
MATTPDNRIERLVHSAIENGALSFSHYQDVHAAAQRVFELRSTCDGIHANEEQRAEGIAKLNYVRSVVRILIGDSVAVPADCFTWSDARFSGVEFEFFEALRRFPGTFSDPVPETPKQTPAAVTAPAVTAPAAAPAAAAPEKPKAIAPIPPVVKDQTSDSITAAWSADRSKATAGLTAEQKEQFRGGVRQAVKAGRLSESRARDYIRYFQKKREAVGLCQAAAQDLWTNCCRAENSDKLRAEAMAACIDELQKVLASFEKTSV